MSAKMQLELWTKAWIFKEKEISQVMKILSVKTLLVRLYVFPSCQWAFIPAIIFTIINMAGFEAFMAAKTKSHICPFRLADLIYTTWKCITKNE